MTVADNRREFTRLAAVFCNRMRDGNGASNPHTIDSTRGMLIHVQAQAIPDRPKHMSFNGAVAFNKHI